MGLASLRKKRKILGCIFLLPTFVVLGFFTFYPLIRSCVMSFTNWSGINSDFSFIGFRNYEKLFTQTPEYWNAIVVNLKFAVTSTLLQTVLGFALAFFVYSMSVKLQKFFKVALFIPVILPAAVVGVMWTFIYTPDYGLINQFLRAVHLGNLTHAWLGEYGTVMPSVIFTNTWRYIGLTMVLYLIAFNNISADILEAATVDGAGKFRQLVSIMFPLTTGTTEINVILSITGGMKAFDLFYLMTGGGPGTATQVVSMLIYRTAFQAFKYSRALSMAVVLFIIITIFTLICMKPFHAHDE